MHTIKDVARLSGTSTATVSRALNNKPVREENYQKITKAMEQLSYTVNNQARSLKTNKTMVAGVVIPRFDHVYFMKIAKEIQINLARHGYLMALTDTDANFEREQQEVKRLVEQNVDGVILVPSTGSGAYLRAYAPATPFVILDQLLDDFKADAVVTDSVNCVYQAVELFVRNGHKRIGIICGPKCLFTSRDRLNGYLRVHEDYGLTVYPELIKNAGYETADGYRAMKEYMGMDAGLRPTAIMATNYDITKGVVMAFQEEGARIPEDYSFIGYDYEELTTIFSPPLSIVVEFLDEIGRRSVDLLVKNMQGLRENGRSEIFRIKPTLLVKDSIRKM